MGGDVPPRVTYWTGIWEPRREALSAGLAALRAALAPRAPVVSFSSGQRTSPLPRGRVVRLSGRRWLALRALAAALEPRGAVTHLVAGLSSWHLLRALGRRPLLFTVAIGGPPLEPDLYRKVDRFVAESEALAGALAACGVDRAKVRVLYPGIDLTRFRPAPGPGRTPFRLLFASSPADPGELEERGVPLLVALARRVPDLEVVVPWRRWGDLAAARRALRALEPPPNFRVVEGDVVDMAAEYRAAHAVVCPFRSGAGKSCPASVVEGLASGRPALLTEGVGIADLVVAEGAGRAAAATVEALADELEALRSGYMGFAARARWLAERHFDRRETWKAYESLYRELAAAA